jgi:hypothetical protein
MSWILRLWFATLVTTFAGCGRGTAPATNQPATACNRNVDLLDADTPMLSVSHEELGERSVTCKSFGDPACEKALKAWGCELGADAVVVVKVQRYYSRSGWGSVLRVGRAIRLVPTPKASGRN